MRRTLITRRHGWTAASTARFVQEVKLIGAMSRLLLRLSASEGFPPSSTQWLPALGRLAALGQSSTTTSSSASLEALAAQRAIDGWRVANLAQYQVQRGEYGNALRTLVPAMLQPRLPAPEGSPPAQLSSAPAAPALSREPQH